MHRLHHIIANRVMVAQLIENTPPVIGDDSN